MKQKALKAQQSSLFFISQTKANGTLFKLRSKVHDFFRKVGGLWLGQSYVLPYVSIGTAQSALKVATNDTAPTYRRSKSHSRKQEITMQWSFPIRRAMPDWVKKFVPIHKEWKGSCSTHPRKGGFKWIAAIGEGRRSSKH